ncbi:unnamed protein product, partial [Didymodactylos carnosus]
EQSPPQQQQQNLTTTHELYNIEVSKRAIDFASEYHYISFIIECEPKLTDKKIALKIVNELFVYIKDDFRRQNPTHASPLLADLWWIDGKGNLRMIIKSNEIYVYLTKKERYPKELLKIKLNPHPPQHLPIQLTAIIKWLNHILR